MEAGIGGAVILIGGVFLAGWAVYKLGKGVVNLIAGPSKQKLEQNKSPKELCQTEQISLKPGSRISDPQFVSLSKEYNDLSLITEARFQIADQLLASSNILPVFENGEPSQWILEVFRNSKQWPDHWVRSFWSSEDKTQKLFVIKWKGTSTTVDYTKIINLKDLQDHQYPDKIQSPSSEENENVKVDKIKKEVWSMHVTKPFKLRSNRKEISLPVGYVIPLEGKPDLNEDICVIKIKKDEDLIPKSFVLRVKNDFAQKHFDVFLGDVVKNPIKVDAKVLWGMLLSLAVVTLVYIAGIIYFCGLPSEGKGDRSVGIDKQVGPNRGFVKYEQSIEDIDKMIKEKIRASLFDVPDPNNFLGK